MMGSALKRATVFVVLTLSLVALGCGKKVTPTAVAGPPPPPPPPPPRPTVTLTADRTAINAGQSVTLSYASTNATAVTIAPGIGAVQPAATGTRQVSPTALTRYSATATGPGGSVTSAEVTISVAAAAPPVAAPPPPAPPRVDPPAPRPPGRTPAEIFRDTMLPILFDYDKATIRADQESKLLNGAAYLKQNPTVRFSIEGHADERGSQEYNIALGDERAAAVKKYLAGQGIADARMTTVSYGEERPACRVESESCFQENRRAAFALIP